MTPSHPVLEAARSCQDWLVGLRQQLHQLPELSYRELATAERVKTELSAMGVPWQAVGEHGVVATVTGQHSRAMVALRADMDALPIQEQNEHLPYRSQVPGVMHACGHDGHVAMLLGAAKVLQQFSGELQGSVKLCFQQAEEQGGGTAELLAHLAAFPVQRAFAIHLWSEIEAGQISVQAGPRMAACDLVEIELGGVSCHGASPHKGVDPIAAGAALVNNLAMMMTREINPAHAASLTFGKFQSGFAGNVIPDQALLAGTLRTTQRHDQQHLHQAIRRVVDSTAASFRAKAQLNIRKGGSMLINEARSSALAAHCASELFGAEAVIDFPSLMVSENFGDFLEKYPGLMALVGVRNEALGACHAHHHPQFNIDESALHRGVALHAEFSLRSLAQLA